jgi:hypothetical protein
MKTSIPVTEYTNFIKTGEISLQEALSKIRNGCFKTEVEELRTLLYQGSKDQYDERKKELLAFTVQGTFKNKRDSEHIKDYNKLIILDIDKIDTDQIDVLKQKASLDTHTYACFKSPSNQGLKIIVPVNSNKENHKEAFEQVAKFYEKSLKVEIDSSGKDVSRLCFYSYDPDIHINEHARVFVIHKEVEKSKSEAVDNATLLSSYERLTRCKEFTEKLNSYHEGNRNNFIHKLACNANRWGINEQDTLEYCLSSFDLNVKEIKTTVNSAYKNNHSEHGSFANVANIATSHSENILHSKEDALFNMPYLPDEVFNNLPGILSKGCEAFSDRRERDVFFTGAITVLSGCLQTVSGGYRGKIHYPNLFSFVIAPAASGKGAITFAKDLGQKYHDKLVKESQAEYKRYLIEEKEYKKQLSNKKIDSSQIEPPEEPPFKVLFIPANNSSARVIQQLQEGEEKGIFCETEADSMGNVLKQDWGGYSDLLRKAFHHEAISYSRKTNKEWVELKKPRLSVALAGTPSQVGNLISSAEDGLFSRFLFYTFKTEIEWIDAGETANGINLTEHFDNLGYDVLRLIEFLEIQPDISFKLTLSQWQKINEYGRECLISIATFVSEDMSSTVKRLAIIVFRIAMIITVLRYYDNGETDTTYTATDEDFDMALSIAKVYQEHSVFMFKELPKQGKVTDEVVRRFYDKLPAKCQRKKAIAIAEEMSIKTRTADLYLQRLCKFKYLKKVKNGFYNKLL